MINEWYAASELAGIEGLPSTARSVKRIAEREGWKHRQRQGQGGGREYHIDSLPAATRAALIAESHAAAKADCPATQAGASAGVKLKMEAVVTSSQTRHSVEKGMATAAMLDGSARSRMDARVHILQMFARFMERFDGSMTDGRYAFAKAFNSGNVAVESWAMDHIRGGRISAASIHRWQGQLQKRGLASLGGNYGNRKGCSPLDTDPDWHRIVTAMIYEHPHATPAMYWRALVALKGDGNIPFQLRTLQRWVKNWKIENERHLLAVSNPDAWKNQFMSATGSASADVVRLNQRWELDSTPADIHLTDGRYVLVGMIDVYSRRSILHVARSSTAEAISAMLRRAIMAYGVPESVKVDNGKDYSSKRIERLCAGLNIEREFSAAFSGWEKPHIERFFRTFSHDICELLPGYSGHNVADAAAIRARKSFADQLFKKNSVVEVKLSAADFQTLCDNWVNGVYMLREHSGINTTPLQRAMQWDGVVNRISDERALDLLLADVPGSDNGERSVTKKGIRITWPGEPAPHWYAGACLYDVPSREKVVVRFDPLGDMSKIYVFFRGDFLGVAECPELCGIDRNTMAAEMKKRQQQITNEQRKAAKEVRKELEAHSLVEAMQEAAAAAARTVVQLPQPTMEHNTADLSAAADAVAADAKAKATPPAPAISPETLAKARAAMEQDDKAPETRDDRRNRYSRIMADPGSTVEDREWARVWALSPEGKAQIAVMKMEQGS